VLLDALRVFDEVFVYTHLAAVGIDGDVDDFGLRYLDAFRRAAVAFGFDGSIV
jgi:hypothetical protein